MNEPETQPTPEPLAPKWSLMANLTDVFVSPGELFDRVKADAPRYLNWLAPMIIAIAASVISAVVMFSVPAVQQEIKASQIKQIDKQVQDGKITREQADKAEEVLDKFIGPVTLRILGAVGGVFSPPTKLFLMALAVFLIGRFAFGAQFEFMKAVEVCGLALTVAVVGTLIAMCLVVIFGSSLANLGPVLLVSPMDMTSKLHLCLSQLNLFQLWFLALVSIGLSRLSGCGSVKSALWIFGVWALTAFLPILIAVRS